MTIDWPPAAGEDGGADGNREQTVDDLLRALLVGDLKVRVDPISGQAIPGEGERPAAEDHP
jgi:hypothetical protein